MKKYLLLFFAMALSASVWAQERTVSGRVTSADDGSALPGVNVVVKGTTNGTVTDSNGNYSLSGIPASGGSLVFSFIGLQTSEVAIGDRSVVDVSLALDVQQLSEVVVTAIGIERDKKALGYAVTNLNSDAIMQRAEPDPVRALSGKIPGVNITGGGGAPGQSTKINIRGFSSLLGNTQPLFVVDGIPFDNSVNASTGASTQTAFANRAYDIDPNNIENITVLKGAAAAALYGSRATNGVIVITTKAGKKSSKKGLEVTLVNNTNIEKISGIPNYQNVYGQGSNQIYNGGFIGNWGSPFAEHVDRLNATYGTNYSKVIVPGYPEGTVPHPLVSTGFALAQGYPAVFPELLDQNGNPIPVPYRPYDVVGGFFETGLTQENSVQINSGGEKANINAGISRMKNDGIVPNSNSSRTSVSFGGNGQLDNGIFVSGNVTYVNTTQQSPPTGGSLFGGNFGTADGSIYTRLFFLPRNFDLNESNPEGIPYPFENPVNGNNVFYRALDNPRWLAKYNKYQSINNRVFGSLTFGYDITDWLNVTLKGGINTYSEERRNFQRPGGIGDANGELFTDLLTNTEQDYNLLLTLNRDLNEDFNIKALVGGNVNQREFNRLFTVGDNIISPNLDRLDGTSTQIVTNDFRRLQRFYALFADVNIGWRNQIFLGIVGRNDWSSTLPIGGNSYFYPGVSLSHVLSETIDLPSIISFAKYRASWTKVGNEAFAYATATPFNLNTPFTTATGSVLNQSSLANTLGNPNLKPEFTTEMEFGAEMQFFNNRLGFDFTYFKRNSTDQITQRDIPRSTGFTRQVVNAGEIENKGIELSLTGTPVSVGNFRWDVTANFTRIRSLVVSVGEGSELFVGGFDTALGTIHRTGSPYGQIYGTKIARSPSGAMLIDKNLGTTIIDPNADIIGDPNPDFNLAVINNFSYKGFTLNFMIDWRQGGDMYLTTLGSLLLRGQLPSTVNREEVRVIPGVYGSTTTFTPILDDSGNEIRNTTGITAFDYYFSDGFGPYGADETNVFDISTVRLRELSLGYSLPKSILSKTPFGSARVTLTGRNLWFYSPNIDPDFNMDPEVLAETAASNVQGFEYGATPTTKRYGFNITLTF